MIRPSRETGEQDDDRKGDLEQEDGDEGRSCDPEQEWVLQGLGADPDHCRRDESDHRCFKTVEESRDPADVSVDRVGPRQAHDEEEGGEYEEDPGDDPARRPVEQPADVDRELLCLGPRQEHAVVEGVEEPLVADPALLIDERVVHDRDLARRPTEVDEAELGPVAEGLREWDEVPPSFTRAFGGVQGHGRRNLIDRFVTRWFTRRSGTLPLSELV